jgi:hypothetical protein
MMPSELLLDTGALVSLLDRSQTHHLKCRRAFADWTGPVMSTEAGADRSHSPPGRCSRQALRLRRRSRLMC